MRLRSRPLLGPGARAYSARSVPAPGPAVFKSSGSYLECPLRDTHREMSEESTTPDRVELLRRGAEALSRRDFDEFMSHFAPHAVWDLNAWGIGTFTGVDAIRAFLEDWLGSYEEYLVEVQEVLDLGHGVVFVAYQEDGRPVGSDGRVERRQAHVTVWAAGVIERATVYTDVDEAHAAAERLAEERG